MPRTVRPLRERLLSRLVPDENGCLLWTGAKVNGYGVVRGESGRTAKSLYTHRVMYEMFAGPIPEGLQLDHLCRNRACANIEHLEPVTMRENILRGDGPPARLARDPACPAGHERTPENTYYAMVRKCRDCRKATARRRYRRERG